MKNKSLPKVDPRLNLPHEEEKILEFWRKEKIFQHSIKDRPKNKAYIFYEGPPTANGKPGFHHLIARSFKDLMLRYKTMRGFRVERKAGWDTHGLPVELQVEKSLNISGKPQIENLIPGDKKASIAKFNALCKESVWSYKEEWEKLTERIGFWLDLKNPYVTYADDYIESLWWILKKVWQKGLLYHDYKVVPYCPRCGTGLSSHEVAQGYKQVKDRSVYVKFKVQGFKNRYLLAWTTTPWTLPGNVALAVGNNIRYNIYHDRISDEEYIMAEALANKVLGQGDFDVTPISVAELVRLSYEPLFQVDKLKTKNSYKVYSADFVSTEDGTGIVHTAVMYGEDDFRLGDKVGLPKHHTVNLEGNFTKAVKGLEGKFVKDQETEEMIIARLQENNLLLKEEKYKHTYPFCWRCDTPLIYYAKASWFIKMSQLREQLLANNATINWIPNHLKEGRFGEWLREVKDWALSRDRYWGTPLPIWQCGQCNYKICVGSRHELQENGGKVPKDLHRPFIDEVILNCPKCKGPMKRFEEVIDVWFDSGAMPFAQWHFPFNQEGGDRRRLEALFSEGQETAIMRDEIAHLVAQIPYPADYIAEAIDQTRGWFYTLLAIATLLDQEAPYKNVISMAHVLDKHGKKMSKSRGNVIDPWEMIAEFGVDPLRFYFYSVNQPSDTKKFDPRDVAVVKRQVFLILWNIYNFLATMAELHNWRPQQSQPGTRQVLDRWLVARMGATINNVTKDLENYDIFHASRHIAEFVNEFSTWYLRLSRKRDDKEFLPTLYWALKQVVKLLAPFTPFFSEILWQKLRLPEDVVSVHLSRWPHSGPVDQQVLDEMMVVRTLVEDGRTQRAEAQIKLRQPLAGAKIVGHKLDQELVQILAQELNVKTVEFQEGKELALRLDTKLNDQLRLEGLVREVIRTIQELRKKAGLKPGEKVKVWIDGTNTLLEQVLKLRSAIEQATSSQIDSKQAPQTKFMKKVESIIIALDIK